jgi:hypothetical protein
MATPLDPEVAVARERVLKSVEEQVKELQPGLEKQAELAAALGDLQQLQLLLGGFPADAGLKQALTIIIQQVMDVQAGTAALSDLGKVLVGLYALQQALAAKTKQWVDQQLATAIDKEKLEGLLLGVVARMRLLLNYRPDVGAILDDLTAMKALRGGPADAVAFHDFQVLQPAFRSVWVHYFDEKLKDAAAQLYEQTARLYDDAGLTMPPVDAINDINQLQDFLTAVNNLNGQSNGIPLDHHEGMEEFPEASAVWNLLSETQRLVVLQMAVYVHDPDTPQDQRDHYRKLVADIFLAPEGRGGRLAKLILEIGRALNEPYAFDVFAPDSFNYGLLLTYRQKWEPGEYQAGDLAATIPLAPSETRRYSKKRVTKTTRAEKEIERSMSSRSLQSSEVSRAEAEIMQKTTTATNFKLTAHGSFNIGIGSIDSTTEFGANQDQQSALSKKAFHEATIKAAEEYRLERSIEVDTSSSVETDEMTSGEISNPNNELTVTYLFYELQRRFKVHEFLYRVRPVILVAQDIPAPHEIDEAWLIQYQWIIARVLLDDSLRPALDYLTSGYAGDEVSVQVIKAQWEAQMKLTTSLESQVNDLLGKRDVLRDALVNTGEQEAIAKSFEMSTAWQVLTLGLAPDPAKMEVDKLEAARKGYEMQVQYSEQALADAQDKLKQASDSLRQSTKEYAAAMRNQYARHVAIDQLRVHVKQNILYYMQAIWDHEPPDQRFFRLYNKKVMCPLPQPICLPKVMHDPQFHLSPGYKGPMMVVVKGVCTPVLGGLEHELVDVADLDNPLGYKGNYIIFPLRDDCYFTTYMVTQFVDNYLGVLDPDGSDDFDAERFDQAWVTAVRDNDRAQQEVLRNQLLKYIRAVRRSTDEIIIPTGQLFIEALPGSHPLLEDFKLLHRLEDVRKVKAEVRRAELENLRLAARVVAGQDKTELLEDPDIEKKVVVGKDSQVVVDTN